MSSDMNFGGLDPVAQWTYGFDFPSPINSAPTSTDVEYPPPMAPTTSAQPGALSPRYYADMMDPTLHQFRAPSPVYRTPSPSTIYQQTASSPVDQGFIPLLDPALMNGSSSDSSFRDASQTEDSAMYPTQDDSVSPESVINQQQPEILAPVLDKRMDLYDVAGAVIPTTVGLEHWIASFVPDLQLQIFQVIDSITHHYTYTDDIPSSTRFRFVNDLTQHSIMAIQSYLVHEYQVKGTTAEVQSLDAIRPAMPRLPIIPAIPEQQVVTGVPIAAPVQHSAANHQAPQAAGAVAGVQPVYPPLTQYMGFRANDPNPQILIIDAAHGRQLREEYNAWHDQTGRTANIPATAAVGIPHDAAGYRNHIGALVAAIYDFSGEYLEKDKKAVKAPRKTVNGVKTGGEVIGHTDNIQAQRVKNAPRIVIEIAASEMLDAAIQAQVGNVGINDWQGLSGWTFKKYETWQQRFTELCEAVRHSKAIIDNVMKLPPLRRLVAAPETEYDRKCTNIITNGKRNQQNAVGVDAFGTGYAKVDQTTGLTTRSDGTVLAPAPDPINGPPAKKARTARGSKRTA